MSDEPNHLRIDGPNKDDSATPATEIHPVDQAIGMEARIMLKAVRVPETGPLADEVKTEIRDTVSAHIAKNKLTLREVAVQVGFGDSTVSEVLRGKYLRADDTDILRKLNLWIDDDERRRRRVQPIGFFPTSVFEAIRALAQYAKSNARIPGSRAQHAGVAGDLPHIVVGWGPAGCGKTLGAAALHVEDTLSIMVRVQTASCTASGLAKLIVESAGWRLKGRDRSPAAFVIEKLRDSGRLLIIDEAHRLKFNACEFIRDLADVCGIPVLLLATEEFYERLTRVRTRAGDLFYDQFSRRVGYQINLVRGIDGQGGVKRPIFSLDEVRGIFSAQTDGLRITPDALDYLCAAACSVALGMLGLAASIFEKATRSALRRNHVIDESLCRKCAARLLIPAGHPETEVLTQLESELQNVRRLTARAAGA